MTGARSIAEEIAATQSALAPFLPEAFPALDADQRARFRALPTAGRVSTGDTLADFTLPDATGEAVSLRTLLASGPAVIVFYRGLWCPFCNVMLAAYARDLAPALEARGVRLAAISPQLPDGSLSTREKHSLPFPVLSDPGNVVAGPLGIVVTQEAGFTAIQRELGALVAEANGQDEPALPMPTVLVVDTDRTIRFAEAHPDWTERTEVATILAAVDALLAVTTPGE
jgi:peroxiredoxin